MPNVYYIAALNYHINCERFDRTLPGFMHRGEWRVREDYRGRMTSHAHSQRKQAVAWILNELKIDSPTHREMVEASNGLQEAMKLASRLTFEGQQAALAALMNDPALNR